MKNTMMVPNMMVRASVAIAVASMAVSFAGCSSPTSSLSPIVRTWKFAVTDDSRAAGGAAAKNNGVSTVVLGAIAKDIVAQGVDFVLFPGDMVTGETDDRTLLASELDTWKTAMAPVYDAAIPVYVTRGNHEYNTYTYGARNPADPSRQTFLDHFPSLPQNGPTGEKGLTYSFTHNNAKIVAFDQYANRTDEYDSRLFASGSNSGQAMNSWVLNEISGSTSGVVFAMAHEEIWPTLSHPDCLANDPDDRDAMVHALATHNGTFFAGHDHMYVRGVMTNGSGDKVPAFTVGTAGGGNYNYGLFDVVTAGYSGPDRYMVQKTISNSTSPTFGYLLVTVNPDDTWSAEFRGFQFKKWNDPTDVSLTPISVWDVFTRSSMLE